MIGVLDTDDNFIFSMAATALHDAGIIFDVVAIPELSGDPSKTNPNDWIRPCRILVASEDASEARSMLEPYRAPTESVQEAAATHRDINFPGRQHDKESAENLSRKESRNPPLVQRVGAAMIGGLPAIGFVALSITALNSNDKTGFAVCIFIAIVYFVVTGRLFRFGFSRRQKQTELVKAPSSK